MKLFDRIVPVIIIFLVGFLAYLLYQNRYQVEEINVSITKNNLNEQFSFSKKDLDTIYKDESYNDKINNLDVVCYHELKRCYEFNNDTIKSIILLKGNKNNSFNNIVVGSNLKDLNLEIEKIDSQDNCYINEINEKYDNYEITYLSKEICDEDDNTINRIIIKKNNLME